MTTNRHNQTLSQVAATAMELVVSIAKEQGLTLELLLPLVRIAWGNTEAATERSYVVPERIRLLALALHDRDQHREAATMLLGYMGGQAMAEAFARKFPGGVAFDNERNWDSMPPDAGDDDCQLCEQERELEPGTFTPHVHAVGTLEHTEIQRFEVPSSPASYTASSGPKWCKSVSVLGKACKKDFLHGGVHSDGAGNVWTDVDPGTR